MLPVFLRFLFCTTITFYIGNNPAHISPFPRGNCTFCCPIEPDQDIEYQLYTRRNPSTQNILTTNDPATLRMSNFNISNPTVFYIHGYSERAPGLSAAMVRDAYLRRGEYNVVLVDWGKLSALPWYITAVKNARLVGPHVARMVRWLDALGAVPMSRVHVIGFSLGAEVAGFMGKSLAPQKVGRITGLDAAFPLYMDTGADGHLTKADASFVDVIHTDGGILGFPTPLGHADFYPNGGRPTQPGCAVDNVVFNGITRLVNQYIACGHNRAWRFYVESVLNPIGFPGSRCFRWRPEIRGNCTWTPDALMGFGVDIRSRGMFYLRTNAQSPFARNTTGYGIRRYFSWDKISEEIGTPVFRIRERNASLPAGSRANGSKHDRSFKLIIENFQSVKKLYHAILCIVNNKPRSRFTVSHDPGYDSINLVAMPAVDNGVYPLEDALQVKFSES